MKIDKAKNKKSLIPKIESQKDDLSNTISAQRFSIKKLLIIIGLIIILPLIGAFLYGIFLGIKENGAADFSWCKVGKMLKLKEASLTVVSLEDYKSPQYEDKVCHLSFTKDDVSSDYYLDETALAKFRGSRDKNTGNGCIVYKIKKDKTGTELCFGDKVKTVYQEERKNSLEKELKQFESKTTPVTSLAGTKWNYRIDVGGGVNGVMSFEKDNNGSLSGMFTEFGPDGKKEKNFIGSKEKDKFLLTLEEFPAFIITLSIDGKTMTGKPVEPVKDIYYPDDFFKATREK